MAEGIIEDITGYITPGGIRRRNRAEQLQGREETRANTALDLQKQNMKLNAIPALMDLQSKRDKQAGWQSARSLWNAYSGGAPEAKRQPSETDTLIQSILAGLK